MAELRMALPKTFLALFVAPCIVARSIVDPGSLRNNGLPVGPEQDLSEPEHSLQQQLQQQQRELQQQQQQIDLQLQQAQPLQRPVEGRALQSTAPTAGTGVQPVPHVLSATENPQLPAQLRPQQDPEKLSQQQLQQLQQQQRELQQRQQQIDLQLQQAQPSQPPAQGRTLQPIASTAGTGVQPVPPILYATDNPQLPAQLRPQQNPEQLSQQQLQQRQRELQQQEQQIDLQLQLEQAQPLQRPLQGRALQPTAPTEGTGVQPVPPVLYATENPQLPAQLRPQQDPGQLSQQQLQQQQRELQQQQQQVDLRLQLQQQQQQQQPQQPQQPQPQPQPLEAQQQEFAEQHDAPQQHPTGPAAGMGVQPVQLASATQNPPEPRRVSRQGPDHGLQEHMPTQHSEGSLPSADLNQRQLWEPPPHALPAAEQAEQVSLQQLPTTESDAQGRNPGQCRCEPGQKVDLGTSAQCHVSRVVARQDHEGSGTGTISLSEVSALYGEASPSVSQGETPVVRPVGETSFSCLDDRLTNPSMSTPGGDIGEFILALASYLVEKGGSQTVPQHTVDVLLARYLDTLPTSRPMVHCTDDRAIRHLEGELPMENLDLAQPPENLKVGLLEKLTEVENQGDSHIRLMLKQPEWFQLDRNLVPTVLKSFYTHLWSGGSKLKLVVLAGDSNPQAFLEVTSAQLCGSRGFAPMLTPRTESHALLISHLDAVTFRREELASFFADVANTSPQKIDQKKLHQRLDRHGWLALETTGSRIAANLPFYTVTYS